jgi:hypothetical protein
MQQPSWTALIQCGPTLSADFVGLLAPVHYFYRVVGVCLTGRLSGARLDNSLNHQNIQINDIGMRLDARSSLVAFAALITIWR